MVRVHSCGTTETWRKRKHRVGKTIRQLLTDPLPKLVLYPMRNDGVKLSVEHVERQRRRPEASVVDDRSSVLTRLKAKVVRGGGGMRCVSGAALES
jgi:hypothetical protein